MSQRQTDDADNTKDIKIDGPIVEQSPGGESRKNIEEQGGGLNNMDPTTQEVADTTPENPDGRKIQPQQQESNVFNLSHNSQELPEMPYDSELNEEEDRPNTERRMSEVIQSSGKIGHLVSLTHRYDYAIPCSYSSNYESRKPDYLLNLREKIDTSSPQKEFVDDASPENKETKGKSPEKNSPPRSIIKNPIKSQKKNTVSQKALSRSASKSLTPVRSQKTMTKWMSRDTLLFPLVGTGSGLKVSSNSKQTHTYKQNMPLKKKDNSGQKPYQNRRDLTPSRRELQKSKSDWKPDMTGTKYEDAKAEVSGKTMLNNFQKSLIECPYCARKFTRHAVGKHITRCPAVPGYKL